MYTEEQIRAAVSKALPGFEPEFGATCVVRLGTEIVFSIHPERVAVYIGSDSDEVDCVDGDLDERLAEAVAWTKTRSQEIAEYAKEDAARLVKLSEGLTKIHERLCRITGET